jgi:hypothetical protein
MTWQLLSSQTEEGCIGFGFLIQDVKKEAVPSRAAIAEEQRLRPSRNPLFCLLSDQTCPLRRRWALLLFLPHPRCCAGWGTLLKEEIE